MRVDPLLLWMITNKLDCSAVQVAANLSVYSKRCTQCPPNMIRNASGSELDFKCWVLRGFYPDTDIMFKLTVTESGDSYTTKVALPNPRYLSKMCAFTKQQINSQLDNVLLGNIQKEKKPVAPRCMTPKGMTPLKRGGK